MQPRAFNQISINIRQGTLTKSSVNKKKLRDEVLYYLDLPGNIANLFPDFIDYNKNYSNYKLEYIPYGTLADLILKNKISKAEGKEIIFHLLKILEKIHSVSPHYSISKNELSDFYINKTKERIKKLEEDSVFQMLLALPAIKINGHRYKNFYSLEKNFASLFRKHEKIHNEIKAIHGDFSLGNILYSSSDKVMKLIDPRGSFIDRGIFGHTLYDYAKLMHCFHGRYDYIVNDQFQLDENDNNFYIQVLHSELMDYLEEVYTDILINKNINMEFIYLIEASLFLSMASLHYECKKRQKMFYFTGLILLNKIVEGKYENMH